MQEITRTRYAKRNVQTDIVKVSSVMTVQVSPMVTSGCETFIRRTCGSILAHQLFPAGVKFNFAVRSALKFGFETTVSHINFGFDPRVLRTSDVSTSSAPAVIKHWHNLNADVASQVPEETGWRDVRYTFYYSTSRRLPPFEYAAKLTFCPCKTFVASIGNLFAKWRVIASNKTTWHRK